MDQQTLASSRLSILRDALQFFMPIIADWYQFGAAVLYSKFCVILVDLINSNKLVDSYL